MCIGSEVVELNAGTDVVEAVDTACHKQRFGEPFMLYYNVFAAESAEWNPTKWWRLVVGRYLHLGRYSVANSWEAE